MLRTLIFSLVLITIGVLEISFSVPQDNFLTVEGRAIYSMKEYGDEIVNVVVTQDGKPYKTLKADKSGSFFTNVEFNHTYIFNLTMNFHGTSKVLVDTKVPAKVSENPAGGVIEFKCLMFELFEGLNTGILNRPIMKVGYVEEKNRFEFDEDYTESLRFELEGFLDEIEELKLAKQKVLKEEKKKAPAPEVVDAENKKERKVIDLEEGKTKISENKRGSKNVMDLKRADEDEDLTREIVYVKPQEEVIVEEIRQEETVEPTEENLSLLVIPERISIAAEDTSSTGLIQNEIDKTQENLEISRIEEETRIRERVKSYNLEIMKRREQRMINRKIQTEMMNSLLKTIAIEEIKLKTDIYRQNPVDHSHLNPSVLSQKNESFWLDEEKLLIRYPNKSLVLRKEVYPFGFTYYYEGDKEIDEATYCAMIKTYSITDIPCEN